VLCLATGARVGLCGSLACACDHCGAATVEMGSSDSHYNVCISCGAGFPLAPPPPRLLHMLGLELRSGCDIQPHISTYVGLRLWSFLGMGGRMDVATGVGFGSVLYDRGEEPPFFSRVFHLYRPPCCERRRRGVLDPPTEPLEPSIPEDDAVDAGSFAAGGAADGTGCAAGGGGGLGETVFLARVAAVDGRAVGSSVSSASPSNSGAPRRVTAVPSRTSAATPASCSRSRPRDNRRAAQAHHSAARRAGRASHRAVDASIAFVAARMAGDGLDAYDALWDTVASDDDDDVSEVRPVLPQRAHSGAPLPRRRSAMPPPYTHDELDRLYAAGCSRYDDDDDDLDAGDALAALA